MDKCTEEGLGRVGTGLGLPVGGRLAIIQCTIEKFNAIMYLFMYLVTCWCFLSASTYLGGGFCMLPENRAIGLQAPFGAYFSSHLLRCFWLFVYLSTPLQLHSTRPFFCSSTSRNSTKSSSSLPRNPGIETASSFQISRPQARYSAVQHSSA